MSHNPYSTPAVTSVNEQRKSTLICTVMFWLSCFLSLGMLGIAVNGGYQYLLYTSQAGIQLPVSILAATVCVACCGLGMLYSAIKWRRQVRRVGAVSFGCSLLAFFVGPPLLSGLM
ncbi:MAG: hypothetical protein AB8B91_07870 [Rubripirellula sp.]